MKKAIQFGAGNIGRGFIGGLLSNAGYHVVFADVNEAILNGINNDKQYKILVKDVECFEQTITNISAVSSISEDIIKEIPKYKSYFVDMKVVFKENGFKTDSQKMNAMQNLMNLTTK